MKNILEHLVSTLDMFKILTEEPELHKRMLHAIDSCYIVPADGRMTSPLCYDGYVYRYFMPICWFRVLPVMFLFDARLNEMMGSNMIVNPSGKFQKIVDLFRSLQRFVKSHAKRLSTIYGDKNKAWALYLLNLTMELKMLTIDDAFVYMMSLFKDFDSTLFPYNKIVGGFGRKNMMNFIQHIFPNIYNGRVSTVSLAQNNSVIATVNPPTRLMRNNYVHPERTALDILFVDYGGFLQNNFNKLVNDNVLALYVEHGGVTYGLTSLLLSDYKKTIWNSFIIGHFAAFFTCNGRFYTNEKKWDHACPCMMFGDVDLIENILLGNTEIPTAINQGEEHKFTCNWFNYNKGLRVGIYLPVHLDFDPDELTQMQKLVEFARKNQMLKALSILCYFTKSMVISFNEKKYKIWSYRSQNVVAWMVAPVVLDNNQWKAHEPKQILQGTRKGLEMDYIFNPDENVVPLIHCIKYIEPVLSNHAGTVNDFKIVEPTQKKKVKFFVRNLRHERVLINVLHKLGLFT